MTAVMIAARLLDLAATMDELAADMVYFGGWGQMADKGREMFGAAAMARTWADGIEAEACVSQYPGEVEEPEEEA